jgi:hypothetical protein
METCGQKCEVFSRIVGYYRPVELWNEGKKEEFEARKEFLESKAMERELSLKAGCPCEAVAVKGH